MNKARAALFPIIALLIFVPSLAKATALSDLTAATATNSILNGNNTQTWDWDSLTASSGLNLYGTSTAPFDGQTFFTVNSGGANSSSNIHTYAALISNGHSGTNSTNFALEGSSVDGAHNHGIYGSAGAGTPASDIGDTGIWGDAVTTSGTTYGVLGTNASSAGYGGYFTNSGGGYAAAFMGGSVGIGTATPQSELHVYGGEVQVGSSGASCATANNGAIRFSSSTIYYCTGTTWTALGGGGSLPSLSSGDIWVGNGSNVATAVAISGDCTISNAGVLTCTKTNGSSFGTLATASGVSLSTQATGTLQAGQFPALTGDVTTTAGGLATTIAAIQGTTVSGTTGTGDVVFSASPNLTGTITDTQSIGAISTDGVVLTDTTAATSGNQKWSPRIRWTGQGWKTNSTAASQEVDAIAEIQPVQGTANPTFNWVLSGQVNNGGYGPLLTVPSGGGLNLNSGVYEINGTQLAASNLLNGVTGSGSIVLSISPTLTTPNIGAATGTSLIIPLIYPPSDGTAAIQIDKADGTSNVVDIDTTNGRVGIGTTSPSRPFDVSLGGSIYSRVASTTSNDAAEEFSSAGTDAYIGRLPASGGGSGTIDFYNNGVHMVITSSGQVGIATTSPSYPLDVTGSIRATQALLSSSAVPTISTCGTSPPAATTGSNNNNGQFTLGTGATTACTVTFANAFPDFAYCTVTPASSYTGTYYISAQSKSAFTVTLGTGTASVKFNYTCGGN